MTPAQRRRIVDRHRDALLRHGWHANALYWSSRAAQETRFAVLAEVGLRPGDRLLDVGCGFGDLAVYLRGQGHAIDYTGIDLSPELIAAGRERYPGLALHAGDLFDVDPAAGAFDVVMLSGALNEALGDDGTYARRVIHRMYATCRRAVAFNLLDARHAWTASRSDLQSFAPQAMLDDCRRLTPHCRLREGYLDNDFSLFLYRTPDPESA